MSTSPHSSQTGTVVTVNHQLVSITGLATIQPGAVVQIADHGLGLVTSFTEESVDAMVFGAEPVTVGAKVKSVQETLRIPVSAQLLGRMITPLGEAMDGRELPPMAHTQPYNMHPLSLPDRARITEPFLTGVGLVDLLLPLGKGQRELIVGDQKAGKSTFLEQVAITQARRGTIIIWAAIGQMASDIKRLSQQLTTANMWDQTVVVASTAQDSASLMYLTPFTAMTLAEYFRDQGLDVLVILDDLTTHARAYREIALLAKRFPGRDSYPGDVFYTHARLLERAGSFIHPTMPNSTVTITCLSVAETTESELTSYIVSNLISITDGHLLFDTELFSQGQRPAVNTGLSVTRVGKQTQTRLQRELNRELTAFMAEYNQTLKLTHFGAELTADTQAILQKGQTLRHFLYQEPSTTLSTETMIIGAMMIWLGWWNTGDLQEILHQRTCLMEQLSRPSSKKLKQLLMEQPDLAALTAQMKKNQSALEALCHV